MADASMSLHYLNDNLISPFRRSGRSMRSGAAVRIYAVAKTQNQKGPLIIITENCVKFFHANLRAMVVNI